MNKLLQRYRILNTLSIDVVVASICCALFFAKFFQTNIDLLKLIVLGLTVWVIYTVDHLGDALKVKGHTKTIRHEFHWVYFKPILIFVVVVSFLNLFFLIFLPLELIKRGCILGAIAFFYLIFSSRLLFLKEFAAALLYVSGILLPVFDNVSPGKTDVLIILQFYSLVLMNLILFSWFDHDHDKGQKTRSFATFYGRKKASAVIIFLFFTNTLCLVLSDFSVPFCFLWGIAMAYLIMLYYSAYFHQHDYYRMAGDALFIIVPALYIWLN
jgi:hypothetical protein